MRPEPLQDSWLLPGPGPIIAATLFVGLAIYALVLFAGTRQRPAASLAWLARHSIRQELITGLGLLAIIPAIALSAILISRAAEQREERATDMLQQSASRVAAGLDQFFEKHETGIASLAASIERAGRYDTQSITEWLLSHHSLYGDYLTMLAATKNGDIITATALVQGRPARIAQLDHNIADRRYFIEPIRRGGVFVSEAFEGRGLGNDPIIAVSALVRHKDQSPWGIVEGSLNLQALSRFAVGSTGAEVSLVILDHRDRVIFSTDGFNEILQPFRVEETESHVRARATSAMGWQAITSMTRASLGRDIRSDTANSAAWLAAAVILAVFLAAAIARRVSRPLQALNDAVRKLDLEGMEADIEPPAGTPREIADVFGYLQSMAERLQNTYRQLTAAIEAGRHYREQLESTLSRREREIRSRTIELEHTNRKLKTLSSVDELTGLPNRRQFGETLDQVWRHCMREQQSVAIVLIDIDHFKAYNDTYGHQAGDQCLSKIGGALSASVWRPFDLVARYGGEEFIMVLANTDLTDALGVAERTRRVVEDLAIEHTGSGSGRVTLSLGAAAVVPGRDSGYDELIQQADDALYHAKAVGRNRVAAGTGKGVAVYRDDDEHHDFEHVVEFRRPAGDS